MAAEQQIVKRQQKTNDRAEWSERIGLPRQSRSSSTGRHHSKSNNSHSCHHPSLSKHFASQQVDVLHSLQAGQEYSVSNGHRSPRNEGACCSKHPMKQWSGMPMAIISRKEVPADLKGRSSTDELSQQCHHKSAAKIAEQQSISTKEESRFISFDRPVCSGKDIDHIIRGDTMTDSSVPQALPSKNQEGHRASVDGDSRGPSKVCNPGLSHKYQPKVFEEIIGNKMVVKALSNAIQTKRVSPLYIFHGPSGTGKTSTAKIFSIALNCESLSPSKPCWKCTSCSRSLYTAELRSGNKNSALENIRTLLEGTTFVQTFPGFKVFIINECHSLAEYSWRELLEMIEEENCDGSLVIILITEDAKAIPRTVSSRCQKFAFAKLKDSDIAQKLATIASHEGIKISKDALQLVAIKADGSLREAEILLDQLALLGQCITTSMVQKLVGLVSHDQLSHLLEAALVSNSLETMRCTRDLIALGVEPQDLVSQLASLVMEILAGDNQPERLCRALKILTETEKQLIISPCNHTTWATAALLQIASGDSFSGSSSDIILPKETTLAGDSSDTACMSDGTDINKPGPSDHIDSNAVRHHAPNSVPEQSTNADSLKESFKRIDVEEVWHSILERIQDKVLAEFLNQKGKLVSLTVSRGDAILHLMFKNSEDKLAAEKSEESISNALKAALGCPVTVNISHEPTQLEFVSTKSTTYNEKQAPDCTQKQRTQFLQISRPSSSLDGRGLVLKRSMSQNSGCTLNSNWRSTKLQNSRQMQAHKEKHISRIIRESIAWSPEIPHISGHLTEGCGDSLIKDPEMASYKQRWLSISSIQQGDASVEPYSQDLLFEEAKADIQMHAKNSKLYKDLLKLKQQSNSMKYMDLNHFWSCTERFCRGETMVNNSIRGFTTNRHMRKWINPCKDPSITNNKAKKAQKYPRKTPPTSSHSSS